MDAITAGQEDLQREIAERRAAEARSAAFSRLAFLLSSAQDPVAAAQNVVETAQDLFQFDAGFLMLYDPKNDRVNDLVNMDTIDGRRQRVPSVLQDKPPSPMMRRVIEHGAQLILRRGPHSAEGTVPFGDTTRFSMSLMYVPLRLEQRCIGVLSLQTYRSEAYTSKDLEALQALADHVAGALGRLQAEAELRSSQERLRLAVESAGLGTWEVEPQTRRLHCSAKCKETFGFTADAVPDFETFWKRFQTEAGEPGVALIEQALRPSCHSPLHVEGRVRRPNGTEAWVILQTRTSAAAGQPGGTRLIGTILDISARKRSERDLRQAQAELQAHAGKLEDIVHQRTARLQETIEELQHFSYALTHDMRAPLRAMQMFAEILEAQPGALWQPESLRYLKLIRLAAHRLDQLVQDSLNYNKAVLRPMVLQPVDLGELLRGLIDTYPHLQPANADVQLEGPLPIVLGNEAALTQCFSNLLDNAVKFVSPGRKPHVRVWAEPRQDGVRVWVEDNGIGIPEPSQGRIFQMFQRATREYEGTGIGLAIVRKVIHRMGGKVGVESKEGEGSRFWVELKQADAAALPLTA